MENQELKNNRHEVIFSKYEEKPFRKIFDSPISETVPETKALDKICGFEEVSGGFKERELHCFASGSGGKSMYEG